MSICRSKRVYIPCVKKEDVNEEENVWSTELALGPRGGLFTLSLAWEETRAQLWDV